jgi:heat shock protein HtpX
MVYWKGARKLTPREKETILPYLQEVCKKARKPVPRIYVYRSKELNAQAVGWNTVILNSALLNKTRAEEIQGIFAHELGHIVHKDFVRLNVASTLNFVGRWGSTIALILMGIITAAGRRIPPLAPLLALVLLLKIFQVAMEWVIVVGLLSVGRKEELRADDYAKELGYGEGLIQFLRRSKNPGRTDQRLMSRLMETHPPAILRVRRLSVSISI